jgi:hypothetical protein
MASAFVLRWTCIGRRLWLLASFLGVIVLVLSTSMTVAAAPPPVIPGLANPSERITSADLERLMDLAVAKQITFAQGKAYYDLLSPTQRDLLRAVVDNRLEQAKLVIGQTTAPGQQVSRRPMGSASTATAGVGVVGWQRGPFTATMYGDCIEGGGWQCWNQPVEYHHDTGTRPSYWWWSQYDCDNDPDTDYVFNILVDLYGDPDGARWFTDDFALWLTTGSGGALNGFGYSYYEMRLCIGDTALIAAGFLGPNAAGQARWHIFGRYN